ncbi:MAG: hypothetical protein J5535_05925 [Firmicutes bacterium]|nr:hypothetical protein [Bacillota bacterium]
MAENKEHRIIGLAPIREYPTYQAVYQLHPQGSSNSGGPGGGSSADGLFRKAVLIVVDWLRKRIEKKGNDASFLDAYPRPEGFADFNLEEAAELTKNESYDVTSIYRPESAEWAFRLSEPSSVVANQSFTTDIGLKRFEDSVLLGIRTVCREEPRDEYAAVFRLDFVCNVLMYDPDIRVTEYGAGQALSDTFIKLNGKSGEQCRILKEQLICNPARRLPVALFYETAMDRMGGELTETVQKIAKAHCYLFCVTDSPYKLLVSNLGRQDLAEAFKAGEECIVIYDPDNIAGIQNVRILNEEAPAEETETGSADGKVETESPEPGSSGETDKPDLVILPDKQPVQKLCESLQNRFRGKKYDYKGICFYSELREKRLLDSLPAVSDPKGREELSGIITELREELEIAERTAAQYFEENESLKARAAKLDKDLRRAHHDNKTEQMQMQLNSLIKEMGSQKDKQKQKDDTIKALKNKNMELRREFRPFAELPLPGNTPREDILNWIRDNYGDRIIIHKRAEKAFLEYDKNVDYMALCRMIHYLYGYTVSADENRGDRNATAEAAKAYDVLSENLAAEPSAKKGTMENQRAEFSIDISEYDPSVGRVLLDLHIKKGKGLDRDMIRIYFCYDSVIKKSIIGYMPGHLDLGR